MVRLVDLILIIIVISQLLNITRLSKISIPKAMKFDNNKVISGSIS